MENIDKKDFAGKNGFIWWVGFVEDRKDPLKLGRCRVRCVGWHSDNKQQLPTKDLPWAMPSFPVNESNTYTPKEFWELTDPIHFHIGGKSKQYIDDFKQWLYSTVDYKS